MSGLQEEDRDTFIELLLGAARALGPVIRSFVSLGLSRQWLSAGSVVFRYAPNPHRLGLSRWGSRHRLDSCSAHLRASVKL